MKIYQEEQILDFDYRVKVIKEILGQENIDRKFQALKRYDIYKDNTKKWVIEKLHQEGLKEQTISSMENRASNISICKKIINKISRAYSFGVERRVENETSQFQIDELYKKLDWNTNLKKTDRYLNLFKNNITGIVPVINREKSIDKPVYELSFKVLSPWQYDVIEYVDNKEKACVYILSDYVERYNKSLPYLIRNNVYGDGLDQSIADAPEDSGQRRREFIWWSNKYHFTTDDKGNIIQEKSPQDFLNPIQKNPFVTVAEDQDGQYWARGGEDLVEGSVLINTLLTDMFAIAYMQGWGQMVITGGESLPNKFEIGPHRALIVKYDKDQDPVPSVDIASANPPLDSWMRAIEQYVALILSTNNLAPSNISMRLDTNTFPSGIAMMIEQSQHTDNIQDKQEMYKQIERELFIIATSWVNYLTDFNGLDDKYLAIGKIDPSLDVSIKFKSPRPIISEKEQLEILQLRKEMGIDSMLDIIKKDNPDMNEEQAQNKLKAILEEKLNSMRNFMPQPKLQEEEVKEVEDEDSLQVQS